VVFVGGGKPEPKSEEFPVSCAGTVILLQTSGVVGKCTLPRYAMWVLSLADINNTEPQKIGSGNSFYPFYP